MDYSRTVGITYDGVKARESIEPGREKRESPTKNEADLIWFPASHEVFGWRSFLEASPQIGAPPGRKQGEWKIPTSKRRKIENSWKPRLIKLHRGARVYQTFKGPERRGRERSNIWSPHFCSWTPSSTETMWLFRLKVWFFSPTWEEKGCFEYVF